MTQEVYKSLKESKIKKKKKIRSEDCSNTTVTHEVTEKTTESVNNNPLSA